MYEDAENIYEVLVEEIEQLKENTFTYIERLNELSRISVNKSIEIREFEADIETLEAKRESIHDMIQRLYLDADLCQTDDAKLKFWQRLLTNLEHLERYARE